MKRKTSNLAALVVLGGFLLGIHEGKVTLWRDGNKHPEKVFDIRADSLPPADRLQLRRGIRVESRESLWLLLENYLE
jgi:uncharacterized membrane protein